VENATICNTEKEAEEIAVQQANLHSFCDANDNVIHFTSYDELQKWQYNNGTDHELLVIEADENESAQKQGTVITYRALGKIHHLILNDDRTITYLDDFSDADVLDAIEDYSFEIVHEGNIASTIFSCYPADLTDFSKELQNNGLPFYPGIKFFIKEKVSIEEYAKRFSIYKKGEEKNEYQDLFDLDNDDSICLGTLYDAIERASEFNEELFKYIKAYMPTLVGTRWTKESLSEHLAAKFGLPVDLQEVDEEGLVGDYAFLWGLFEEWGYVDIYYLKIPIGEQSIYITEINVSKE